MNIRPASEADLQAISLILNQAIEEQRTAFSEPVTAQQLQPWLEEHLADGLPVVAAEQEGAVIAWGSLSAYRRGRKALSGTAEITFYVDRQYRGKGVGSALIAHLEEAARSRAIKNLFGIILDDNVASIGMMKKCGYAQWGHMPHIAEFDGNTKGHVYMGKHL